MGKMDGMSEMDKRDGMDGMGAMDKVDEMIRQCHNRETRLILDLILCYYFASKSVFRRATLAPSQSGAEQAHVETCKA